MHYSAQMDLINKLEMHVIRVINRLCCEQIINKRKGT